MKDAQPKAIYLKDYTAPNYLISTTDLSFQLYDGYTAVTAVINFYKNPKSSEDNRLVLHGEALNLQSISIDNSLLLPTDYRIDNKSLTLANVPDRFELKTIVHIDPAKNKALEGLYRSRTMYCTQCEAEGFRKITYYLDRPDVLAKFSTRIEADKDAFPILLSNGNKTDSGETEAGRHFALWHDPFPKPCYLFALVAGNLACVSDTFTTMSGRIVDIELYVETKDLDKCEHAIASLQRAMKWDEDVYGREYDLSVYMIVAVDDFNMGAMENKGLNIFNTSCVLAHPSTTTDTSFQRIEAIVAHEYFHNWSGNRVTCRDWFQLSLKEGLTVFRDAEFSADMGSRTVKRVEDVNFLKTAQFAEDSGPMAHPIQPASFIEISNFYTVTIYEKGAEVVRMIHELLGAKEYRKATDLYFERHDGQAATCDDFVQAMADSSGRDFSQFKHWYSQAGTPQVSVKGSYDPAQKTFSLTMQQHCPNTPGQNDKKAFFIPVKIALIDTDGPVPLFNQTKDLGLETVLELTETEQTFVFENIDSDVVPSLLRGFSAPVKLEYNYTTENLLHLINHDNDGFNKWDAVQRIATKELLDIVNNNRSALSHEFINGLKGLLKTDLDPAMVGLVLRLPSQNYLTEISANVNPQAIHAARELARLNIATALKDILWERYQSLHIKQSYKANNEQIAKRSLRNTCLAYLSLLNDDIINQAILDQYYNANNMTDQFAAFSAIVHSPSTLLSAKASTVLEDFYKQWKHEALVVNQWFQVQATHAHKNALTAIKDLMQHPDFDINNPNKVRSVVSAFTGINSSFHSKNGASYAWLADIVIQLNASNPQIASRLVTPLTRWKKYTKPFSNLMKIELQRIAKEPDLSKDVYEVVNKSLA